MAASIAIYNYMGSLDPIFGVVRKFCGLVVMQKLIKGCGSGGNGMANGLKLPNGRVIKKVSERSIQGGRKGILDPNEHYK